MSARRIVQRRNWRSDCPPVFDQRQKANRAYAYGRKIEPRKSWREWQSKSHHLGRGEKPAEVRS